MARPGAALCALLVAAVGVAGCGEEDGVADGATVSVYVEQPLCGRAAPAAIVGDEDGEGFGVRFVCLPSARGAGLSQGVGGGTQVDLARAGANARRATEDSTSVAYLQPDDPAVNRFTEPILEAAGIGWITSSSAAAARARALTLLGEADSGSLRAELRDALAPG